MSETGVERHGVIRVTYLAIVYALIFVNSHLTPRTNG